MNNMYWYLIIYNVIFFLLHAVSFRGNQRKSNFKILFPIFDMVCWVAAVNATLYKERIREIFSLLTLLIREITKTINGNLRLFVVLKDHGIIWIILSYLNAPSKSKKYSYLRFKKHHMLLLVLGYKEKHVFEILYT